MAEASSKVVPVWTLATGDVPLPDVVIDGVMTAERLTELRSALAAMADQPVATLELHPLPERVDRRAGIPLDGASPLAKHLSQLVTQRAGGASKAATAADSGETLFRMVVPAKYSADFAKGVIRPMQAKGVVDGIRTPLMGAKGVVGQVSFVPAGATAAAGGAGAAAGGAAGGVALGTAVTVAAPLVLMAVAVAVSASAERQRQQAIEHITDLLEGLHEQSLDAERSDLDGCRSAIDKATAVLLDQGKLGVALGLDSAVHAIDRALAAAERRLAVWQRALEQLPGGMPVEIDTLTDSFPGIDGSGGTFRAHLELAALAIALKRRVIVLQAVDHAQQEPGNQFENFTRALRTDQRHLDEVEDGIVGVLVRLASLKLGRPRGWRAPVFTAGEVDRLLRSIDLIRSLDDDVVHERRTTDVAIEIARQRNGSLIVFPATAV